MRSHRKHRTTLCGLLISLAVMLLLSACGNGPNSTKTHTKAPDSQQIYRNPIVAPDIETFDPAKAVDFGSLASIQMAFTGLVTENDHLQVQGELAKSYEESADGLSWTFHLRPNLTFSDGAPLTSHDVVYSLDRALSPQVYQGSGTSLFYLGLIRGADDRANAKIPTLIGTSLQTPDDNTVVIQVSQKTAYFLQALTYQTADVVEKKVIDQWGDKWTEHLSDNGGQGGDGPFKVQKYDHNTGITFVPNPGYFGPQPQLKQVIFPFVKDTGTSYLEYKTSQLDKSAIPTADYQQAQAMTDQFHKVPQLWVEYYGMNYLVKPFDNIHIRQALALAINKDVLVQSIWGGRYVPTNHIIPNGMPGYNPHLTGPAGVASTKGDPKKAKELFQLGLQEEHLTLATFPTIKFTYPSNSQEAANEATTMIQMWQQVLDITSIKPDVVDDNQIDADVAKTKGNGSMQMWRNSWSADYPDPQDWTSLQFTQNSPDNENYGQNTSTDAAQQQATQQQMAQADVMSDQVARFHLYNQIEQQLVNDVVWLPMEQIAVTYLLKPYVIGVVDNAQYTVPPDDWGKIYIAAH